MNFNHNRFQENIKLRSDYRKARHSLWVNRITDSKELEKCNLIKREILKLESNESKKFYRYKSFHDWDDKRLESEINCIINNKLAFITPTLFNDPYDCRPPIKSMQEFLKKTISNPIQQYKFKKEARNAVKRISPSTDNKKIADKFFQGHKEKILERKYSEERIGSIRKGIPIICFANKPNDMYFWSHYAGTHQGFCLEYEFNDNLFDEYLHPVEYTDTWPNDLKTITDKGMISMILVKSMDWSKEFEWRMAAQYNEECDQEVTILNSPSGLKISAIYLGLDFFKSIDNKNRIKLMDSFKGQKIFQMVLEDDSYTMIPIQI